MSLAEDIFDWIFKKQEFTFKEFRQKFPYSDSLDFLKFLEQERIILNTIESKDIKKREFILLEKSNILKNKTYSEILPKFEEFLKSYDNIQGQEDNNLGWEDINEISEFKIYKGNEMNIYEIHLKEKKIVLEGKEIMDYNIFRLKFFEEFGILLPTFKGIQSDWANLVSYWNKNYGVILKDKTENISDKQRAKEIVIDYINNSTLSDSYVVKEGIICLREDVIFVPSSIIQKILHREKINISLRKLSYILDDYIESGTIPLKVDNKSERFWKFKKNKFDLDEDEKLEIQEEEDG